MTAPIHIALTFDDNFWAPAYALMRSVCLFTRRRRDLVFHLCHRTLLPAHQTDLEGIAEEFGGTCFLRFDDTNPGKEGVEFVEATGSGEITFVEDDVNKAWASSSRSGTTIHAGFSLALGTVSTIQATCTLATMMSHSTMTV